MISKELHNELIDKWAKVGRGVYQKISRRHRLKYFMNHVDLFKGKDVVEYGCNAGLYGYEISQVANSYTGVDKGDYYILQSEITKKYMKNPNVTFYNESVKSFIKRDLRGEAPKYNALFASFVLYHLSKKETDRIAETVLPKCDIVVIPTRTKKRTPWKNYNPYKFNKPENVKKYLEKSGFKVEIVWPEGTAATQKKQKYCYVIGKRKAEEKLQVITKEAVVPSKCSRIVCEHPSKEALENVQTVSSPTKTTEEKPNETKNVRGPKETNVRPKEPVKTPDKKPDTDREVGVKKTVESDSAPLNKRGPVANGD